MTTTSKKAPTLRIATIEAASFFVSSRLVFWDEMERDKKDTAESVTIFKKKTKVYASNKYNLHIYFLTMFVENFETYI
ncbi:MAG: hypothetical protein RLZZ312_1915 [Bacteroidota bacterium]|jgi:hypothetical protein